MSDHSELLALSIALKPSIIRLLAPIFSELTDAQQVSQEASAVQRSIQH